MIEVGGEASLVHPWESQVQGRAMTFLAGAAFPPVPFLNTRDLSMGLVGLARKSHPLNTARSEGTS